MRAPRRGGIVVELGSSQPVQRAVRLHSPRTRQARNGVGGATQLAGLSDAHRPAVTRDQRRGVRRRGRDERLRNPTMRSATTGIRDRGAQADLIRVAARAGGTSVRWRRRAQAAPRRGELPADADSARTDARVRRGVRFGRWLYTAIETTASMAINQQPRAARGPLHDYAGGARPRHGPRTGWAADTFTALRAAGKPIGFNEDTAAS